MEKVWVLKVGRYIRFYKSEKELVKHIVLDPKYSTKQEVLEFELKSITNSEDYIKSTDRNIQIESILGNLSDKKNNLLKLISILEDREDKSNIILNLRKLKTNSDKNIDNFFIRNKVLLFSIYNDVDWLEAILGVYNFRNCIITWQGKNTSKILIDNFSIAKKRIKENGKNKKSV